MTTQEKIRFFRMDHGWSQYQLADKLGLSHNSVSLIETGKMKLTWDLVCKIAAALEVKTDDLADDEVLRFPVVLDYLAYMPERAHDTDAGYDLRSPIYNVIPAHGSTTIDTGVHIAIPKGYAGFIKSKSGLNVKNGILSEGLIDSGYTGSIRVKLYNHTGISYEVRPGDKISQIVFLPIAEPELFQIDNLPETERGDGGFGSTGV